MGRTNYVGVSAPKLYLIVIKNNLVDCIHTLQELNGLHQLCIEKSETSNCILIHCGFTRPKVEHYINVPDSALGKVLYSGALKWILPNWYKSSRNAITKITLNEFEIPCYLALNRWGYEIEDTDSAAITKEVELPPLLIEPIEFLKLSVRSKNCLRGEQIRTIADLVQCTRTKLLTIQNFGKSSLVEIESALALHDLSLGTNLREWSPDKLVDSSVHLSHESVLKDSSLQISGLTLKEHFDRVLEILPDRDKQILMLRFGGFGSKLTLDEIGESINVTRERVRQIELSSIKRIKLLIDQEGLGDLVESHIGKLLLDRKIPLILELLDIEDEWFKGFEGNYIYLTNVIQTFAQKDSIHIINAVGLNVVSRIKQNEWDALINKLREKLKLKAVEKKWNRIDIGQYFESSLFEYKSQELSDLLHQQFDEYLQYHDESQQAPLVAFGKTVDSMIMTVLSRAESPLHHSEIVRRVTNLLGKKADKNSVHGALNRIPVVWLYSRGTYGLIDHCPLQFPERKNVCNKVEEIIYSAPINKQWHSHEITVQLADYFPDLKKILNPYVLRMCIQDSPKIIYLGRMVWARSDSGMCVGDRLETTDAFIAILEDAGKPLSSQELKQRLSKVRGVSNNLQVHGNERLVQVGRSLWGLSDWSNC